jgi:hypothetical protein
MQMSASAALAETDQSMMSAHKPLHLFKAKAADTRTQINRLT